MTRLAVVDHNPGRSRFDVIFDTHYGAVLAYCRRRTGSDTDAADAAAGTFEVAWRRLNEVPDQPRPWLYGVARRVLANTWRGDERRERLQGRLQVVPPPQPPLDPADDAVEASNARAALARLSSDDRELLMLVAWEGLDANAAAETLGITPSTFAVRLHRARRRLEKELS